MAHPFFSELNNSHPQYDLLGGRVLENDLHNRAELFQLNPALKGPVEISNYMRAILVDWLVDVSVHFEVQTETLHLAVCYLNRYL